MPTARESTEQHWLWPQRDGGSYHPGLGSTCVWWQGKECGLWLSEERKHGNPGDKPPKFVEDLPLAREVNVSCLSTCGIRSPNLWAALRSLTLYWVPSRQIKWALSWARELTVGAFPWRVKAHQRKKSFHKHRFLLDFDCGKTNLQLGITENPQREELLRKCFNYGCEWWKAGWTTDRRIRVWIQCLPSSSCNGFE